MLYLITDTHIGHKPIISYCGRPENFGTLIEKNWKRMVQPTDTIIHLGDVAWGEENLKRLTHLPGKKILVRGNHDAKSLPYYAEAGFDFACDSITMRLEGINILFTHHPAYGHTADINIHGHLHDLHREDFSRLYLPLSLENIGYKPLPVDKKFLHTLRAWVEGKHTPTIKEIMLLGQNYLETPRPQDLYGSGSTKELYDARVARRKEADKILASCGLREWRRDKALVETYNKYIYGGASKEDLTTVAMGVGSSPLGE